MTKLLVQTSPEILPNKSFEIEARLGEVAAIDLTTEHDVHLESTRILLDQSESLFAPELDQQPILEISEVQGSEGIFNVTVLDVAGVKYLFGRMVHEAAIVGEPDFGSLVMAELGPSRDIVVTTEIWSPEGQDILIEDPRASQADDGRTVIGVTAVCKNDNYRTYPALIELNTPDQLLAQPFPKLRIINKYGRGDQTTPIGEVAQGKNATTIDDKHFMFRPDQRNHSLQVLDYDNEDASHVGFIEFPDNISGASYKIGTTTPPEWLNDKEAFFVFHGIEKLIDGRVVSPDTLDSRVVYRYSIHSARLMRQVDVSGRVSFAVDNISRQPIITPDSFPRLNDGREVELHPDIRQVTYSCGGIATKDANKQLLKLELFVNQGDKRTWLAVLAANEIIAGWRR